MSGAYIETVDKELHGFIGLSDSFIWILPKKPARAGSMICCPYKYRQIFVGAEYEVRQHTKCVDRIIRPTTMVFMDFTH
jgi:hypothetical protein